MSNFEAVDDSTDSTVKTICNLHEFGLWLLLGHDGAKARKWAFRVNNLPVQCIATSTMLTLVCLRQYLASLPPTGNVQEEICAVDIPNH